MTETLSIPNASLPAPSSSVEVVTRSVSESAVWATVADTDTPPLQLLRVPGLDCCHTCCPSTNTWPCSPSHESNDMYVKDIRTSVCGIAVA